MAWIIFSCVFLPSISAPLLSARAGEEIPTPRNLTPVISDYKIPPGNLSLNMPSGIALDTYGNLYVTDTLNHRIVIFDPSGKAARTFGRLGDGPEALDTPMAVAVDSTRRRVYVADSSNHRIQAFDTNGVHAATFSMESGKPAEEKNGRPLGIAIDSEGNLFVTDAENHLIRKFSPQGDPLLKFGGPGEKEGFFYVPVGIAVDRKDRVYVVDMNNSRVQVFDAEGRFLSKFGELGNIPGTFFRPKWICVDPKGFIYVADAGNLVVEVFDGEGKFQYLIGEEKELAAQFASPFGVAFSRGCLFVSDRWKNSIRVFEIA